MTDLYLDFEAYEKEQKWRKVKEKYVPLILGWRAAGYSMKEVHDFLYDMHQSGKITTSEYLILEPEADKNYDSQRID